MVILPLVDSDKGPIIDYVFIEETPYNTNEVSEVNMFCTDDILNEPLRHIDPSGNTHGNCIRTADILYHDEIFNDVRKGVSIHKVFLISDFFKNKMVL